MNQMEESAVAPDAYAVDSGLFTPTIIGHVEQLDKPWVADSEKNRILYSKGKQYNCETFNATLPAEAFKPITVRLAIYVFTNMLVWNPTKLLQVRLHRWDIEALHEQIKQFLGTESSQLQTETGVRKHLTLVFVVNSLLKSIELSSPIRELSIQ